MSEVGAMQFHWQSMAAGFRLGFSDHVRIDIDADDTCRRKPVFEKRE